MSASPRRSTGCSTVPGREPTICLRWFRSPAALNPWLATAGSLAATLPVRESKCVCVAAAVPRVPPLSDGCRRAPANQRCLRGVYWRVSSPASTAFKRAAGVEGALTGGAGRVPQVARRPADARSTARPAMGS
jgi:hypothetical protein